MKRTAILAIATVLVAAMASPALATEGRDRAEPVEKPFSTTVIGCSESVEVTGTETTTVDYWWANDGIQQYSRLVTWEATGIGVTSSEPYEVTYRYHTEGVGWPPLTEPTQNILHYEKRLMLKSVVAGSEVHRQSFRRILLSPGHPGTQLNPTALFRMSDNC